MISIEEVTLHHSSLSNCVFGMLACQIGYYDEAYEYFAQSARMDLDDYHDNFYAGIHACKYGRNLAGNYQRICRCEGKRRVNWNCILMFQSCGRVCSLTFYTGEES